MILVPIRQDVQNFLILRVNENAVVLLAAGVSLEFIDGERFRQFLWLGVEAVEITHSGHAGDVETTADFLGGKNLPERLNHCPHQPTGDTVIAGQKAVFLSEALAAGADVTAFAKDEEGVSAEGNILNDLLAIVVYTVCPASASRTNVSFSG